MSKHTPGPWEVLPDEEAAAYLRIRGATLGRLHKVANVPIIAWDSPLLEQQRANARMIAAAPDMLAALQAIRMRLAVGSTYRMGTMIDEIAQAAIAKATGKG